LLRSGAVEKAKDELLTVAEVLAELNGVARSTFNKWRALGIAPRCIKLPNGDLRVRRSVLQAWVAEREELPA
jgi:predicted DNA-binding transcriptional regulator AlpA